MAGKRTFTVARRLKKKAAEAGANLSYYEYPEMLHVWMTVPMPEALKARDEIAAFMKG
jgi:acetyl esterase/lipase